MPTELEFISALAEELNGELAGGRIEKIQQPAKDILIFTVRKNGCNSRLLISAGGGKSRMHLTTSQFENPAEPPMFCMLLRKHLNGALISEVRQVNEDKIIFIGYKSSDELGRASEGKIYIELMSRSPNIVLVGQDGFIVDCIRRRDYDSDMFRRVFPGMIYRIPKKPDVYSERETKFNLSSPSESLDVFFSKKDQDDIFRTKSREIRTVVNNALKRTEKKLGARRSEMLRTEGREDIRHRADLITANIWRIKKGDRVLECEDFYNDNTVIRIELNPLKTAQANSATLYREYNKLKSAEEYLTRLIAEAEQQLDYLNSCADEISRAKSEKDIAEIKNELISTGYIRAKNKKNSKQLKIKSQSPISFESPGGYEILCGRNNNQNDELTFKTADRRDIWFHAKNYHGSHVILRTAGLIAADEDIIAAAKIAAENSQAGGACYVDYCQVRFVKKPGGSMPGKVIYTNYTTIKV